MCTEGKNQLTGIQFKECLDTCVGKECNNDQSVEELFAHKDQDGNKLPLECISCSSLRDDDSSLEKCRESSSSLSCPTYASKEWSYY